MADDSQSDAQADVEAVDLGNYEVIRQRLLKQGAELSTALEALNAERRDTFGGIELEPIGSETVRTKNSCVPRDIVQINGHKLFGYHVELHLRTETKLEDVFTIHKFDLHDSTANLVNLPLEEAANGFLADPVFQRDFTELFGFYPNAHLLALRSDATKLLAVFQIGNTVDDVRVMRWSIDAEGRAQYIDARGDADYTFPEPFDFEWTLTDRNDFVRGQHPHVNILDEVFVETIGGDLTIKVEDNTAAGSGVFSEPVADRNQSLDDAEISYAALGSLILLKVLPYREPNHRYLVFNRRTQQVVRIDAIGQACVQLPENHGIIFPGGYYLQTGDYKVFPDDIDELQYKRAIRAPNGEDVMYVFNHRERGSYVLYAYNLVRKEVHRPIQCHGYSLFDDGTLVFFKRDNDRPSQAHEMQIWRTPFMSELHAAQAPKADNFFGRIGNAELVRGISDALTTCRLIEASDPNRKTFEALIKHVTRVIDSYSHWLGAKQVGDLASRLQETRRTAELIIGEFDKVQELKKTAATALEEAAKKQNALVRTLHPEQWKEVERFLQAMTDLRQQRGHLITLRELRYIDLEALDAFEQQMVERFDQVSAACVTFLLGGSAFEPLEANLESVLERVGQVEKATELKPLAEELEQLTEGLNLLAEVVSGLEVDDPTQRTEILEQISEVFGVLNRVRAGLQNRRKALMSTEGKAEFGAQFKLFGQAVASALALCDTPERTDEQLSRLMVQLEELEARFSEFDEFLVELADKRDEVYEAFGTRKQTLQDERGRRVQNTLRATQRIIEGVKRRSRAFKTDDELNTYYASDPMVMKLRQLAEQLANLGDSVKSDEVLAQLKGAKQDALRGLRDKQDLFEEGENLIKLGKHKFSVNVQALELALIPRETDAGVRMFAHLGGTDFYEEVGDPEFEATRPYWDQVTVSESPEVYKGEYLASLVFFDAEDGKNGLSLQALHDISREDGGLMTVVRRYAAERYEEGYERGLHDADATAILTRLLSMRASAGLLRFPSAVRAQALLYWAFLDDADHKRRIEHKASSLGRLRTSFANTPAIAAIALDISSHMETFAEQERLGASPEDLRLAGRYLIEELTAGTAKFVASGEAIALRDALFAHLERSGSRRELTDDLDAQDQDTGARYRLARAWLQAMVEHNAELASLAPVVDEGAALIAIGDRLDLEPSTVITSADVEGLLGQHSRIENGKMPLRLEEFVRRLTHYHDTIVPGYQAYRKARHALLEAERDRLRISEYTPRVMTAFVRNKLINDVYLPLIGDNLAKQIGASGAAKRTDLMGLLLLVSPPGYGKTTLMEYIASRLGLVFMKVNGPALGHGVMSLDPDEAPNATARQEVEKINLAFEMGNNVMLYLDDIQHTHPELLQKFISLCDAQRRIEGVWKGRTRTYDFRGKKFCVVMAGNPYTEAGEKFQIPDMLANRADTYNLGDILTGRGDAFALSYVENSLTSNPVLAPLATRDYSDVYKLIAMAQGAEVPTTDLSHGYGGVELNEIVEVFKKLFVARDVLLKVNQEYIRSASMDDKFRTEPRFQLQGSYRNMNKLVEKIVSAMNDEELQALIDDHYQSESQTLTSGAESNLLKFAELRGAMSETQAARWEDIRKNFRRIQLMGGDADDPVSRVTGTLGGLGDQLDGIGTAIRRAVDDLAAREAARAQPDAEQEHPLERPLKSLQRTIREAAKPKARPELTERLTGLEAALMHLAEQKLEVTIQNAAPPGVDELLAQQVAIVERTLVPLVQTTTRNLEDGVAIGRKLNELIQLLHELDTQIKAGFSIDNPAAESINEMDTQKMKAIKPK